MKKLFAALALAFTGTFSITSAADILQTSNEMTGNQFYSGVGVEFDVNSAITVSELGIYDSDQNGIAADPSTPLSAYLLTNVGGVVASMTFDSGSQGTLDAASKYRFKSITPVTLLPGTYVLAGYGWTANDPEHNSNVGGSPDTFNTGGGLLTYDASLWGGGSDPAGTLPFISGSPNFFSAANMEFAAAIPEPEIYAMMGIGLLLMGFVARRRKL